MVKTYLCLRDGGDVTSHEACNAINNVILVDQNITITSQTIFHLPGVPADNISFREPQPTIWVIHRNPQKHAICIQHASISLQAGTGEDNHSSYKSQGTKNPHPKPKFIKKHGTLTSGLFCSAPISKFISLENSRP